MNIKFTQCHVAVCCAETVPTEHGVTYVWPDTSAGRTAVFSCPRSPQFNVTRECNSTGEWQAFDETGCGVVSEDLNGLENIFSNVRMKHCQVI